MVNNNRLFIGLILIFILFLVFYYSLDQIFICILSLLFLFDLIHSKIFKIKDLLISILFFILILFLLNLLNLVVPIIYFFCAISLLISIFFVNYRNYSFLFFILTSLLFMYLLINLDRNIFYFSIIICFLNDTLAYIFGNLIKGPLITPNISPKKTWSGTIISILITSFILIYFDYSYVFSFTVALSLFLGDLYFSFIKRKYFLKDFSSLLLSHGGFLDRFDSIFPVIILFYFNISLFN